MIKANVLEFLVQRWGEKSLAEEALEGLPACLDLFNRKPLGFTGDDTMGLLGFATIEELAPAFESASEAKSSLW